jgi:hypothetical protein
MVDRPVGVERVLELYLWQTFFNFEGSWDHSRASFLCAMCEGSRYRSGRSAHWVKIKNSESARCDARGGRELGTIKQKGRDLRGLSSFEETRERPSYRPLNTKSD